MNLYLTSNDQIINLDCIAAIEIKQFPANQAEVHYHLVTGVTIVSRLPSWDAASSEKWLAFQQLKQILPQCEHGEFKRPNSLPNG